MPTAGVADPAARLRRRRARRIRGSCPPAGVNLSALPTRLRDDLLDARRGRRRPRPARAALQARCAERARRPARRRAHAPPRRRGRAARRSSTILPSRSRAPASSRSSVSRARCSTWREITRARLPRASASIRGCSSSVARVGDRAERVAQLVAEHREELVLRAARRLGGGARLALAPQELFALRLVLRRARRRQRRARCRPRGSREIGVRAAPRPRAGRAPARRRSARPSGAVMPRAMASAASTPSAIDRIIPPP